MDEKEISYWERRKAQRMWEHMQSAEDTADEIAQAYWKATGYLNHNLNQIYDRFKAKHHLSDAEARRLLNRMHDRTSFDELHSLLKQETDSEEKKELLKLIESPAYSARIQRLQDTQREIDQLMNSVYQLEKDRSTRHYTDLIGESYYKSIYDVQHTTGLGFSFAKISPKQINRVLKSKWSGVNYSSRIWQNTDKLAQDLKEELLINILTGRSDREVAEIISNKFSSGAMEARRLVRTESCYIANEMEAQSYEECDINKYMFVATLDKRTSKVCQNHDHKVYKVKDRQPGKNYPPLHPWCRSTTIAHLDNRALEGLQRRARDPETGKTYLVPADMSYPEWYDKYVEKVPTKKAAANSYKNKVSDKAQYNKYVEALGKENMPASFEKFQKLKYNDVEKWGYLKDYKKSRSNNMISSFTPFDQYVEYKNRINDELIGIVTPDGVEIKSQSKHFIERVFGTTEDPKTGKPRDGVSLEEIAEALKEGKVRKREDSWKYIKDGCSVSINPETGNIIQVNVIKKRGQ